MEIVRITANLAVADIASAAPFYRDVLGLSEVEFDLGWVTRLTSPDSGASIQLVSTDASAPAVPTLSIHVVDVDAAYEEVTALGHEIVHPLTTEDWGVRRFLVRAPDGTVVNIVRHAR